MKSIPHALAGYSSLLATKHFIGDGILTTIDFTIPYLPTTPLTIPIRIYLIVGIILGIITHFILDYINERGLSFKDDVKFDIIPHVLCYIIAFATGQFGLFLVGSTSGNLPDLIDKKLYLSMFLPKKFKMTQYLHWQKILVEPTPTHTKAIGIISAIIIIALLFLSKNYVI